MKQGVLYDVVIIGGGPAGCATAIALHNLGVENILVAEMGDYTGMRIGESIPPNTKDLLFQLGLWQAFEQENHEVCLGSYSSWGSNTLGYNDFLFNARGHGWHLDRLKFDRFLADQLTRLNITLGMKLGFADVQCDDRPYPINIHFKGNFNVRCRFVVDASGRSAKVARRMGAVRQVEDQLLCVAAYFDLEEVNDKQSLKRMTLLEGVESGWWYSARLPDNRIIAAFAGDPLFIKQQKLKNVSAWHNALKQTHHISALFTAKAPPESIHTWVAQSALLNSPAGAGWAAVGDSASTFDPISSQGIYKALQHGLSAAPAIAAWLNGDSQPLGDYRQKVGEEFIHYLSQRCYFYALEQRWPNSIFWQKRQAAFQQSINTPAKASEGSVAL